MAPSGSPQSNNDNNIHGDVHHHHSSSNSSSSSSVAPMDDDRSTYYFPDTNTKKKKKKKTMTAVAVSSRRSTTMLITLVVLATWRISTIEFLSLSSTMNDFAGITSVSIFTGPEASNVNNLTATNDASSGSTSDHDDHVDNENDDQDNGERTTNEQQNPNEAKKKGGLLDETLPGTHDLFWIYNTTEQILPLVDPFGGPGEINKVTNESIFYSPDVPEDSDVVYSFPCNGQGGQHKNVHYTRQHLRSRLIRGVATNSNDNSKDNDNDFIPVKVFSKDEAVKCLQGSWIHIDGDSLARDMYYDISELFGLGWNSKAKVLHDMEFNTTTKTMTAARITFSGRTTSIETEPNWKLFVVNETLDDVKNCPDLWLYSTGLWDHPKNTDNETYTERIQAVAEFSDNSCVKHKILRYTTPYADPFRTYHNNPNTRGWNEIATRLLVTPNSTGFQFLDTYTILESRRDLTHDNIHYTGPGSKWVTNMLLNMVCAY